MATHPERLRAEFTAVGGAMSTGAFARHCLQRGFYSPETLQVRQLQLVQSDIRRALAAEGPDGLPFAQPVGPETDGDAGAERPAPVWKQLALFTYPELAALLRRRRDELQRDGARYRRLHDYCRLRFGKVPRLAAVDVGP